MAFARKSGGSNVTPTTVKRRSGGAWVNVQTIKRRLSGAWVTVWNAYTPMTVTVANVSGSTRVGVNGDLIGTATINVSGGQSPFTYSTVYKFGASFTISNATTSHPQFNRPGNPGSGIVSGTYTATVTDATGASVSKDFTVTDERSF